MAAEIIPLRTVALPIMRPQFDRSHIRCKEQWCLDNAAALDRYWQRLGATLGITQEDIEEFDYWLDAQWDIERGLLMLPHGSSL